MFIKWMTCYIVGRHKKAEKSDEREDGGLSEPR